VIGAAAAALLRALTAARAERFERALSDCAAAQRQTRARLVCAVAATDYGRHFGLRSHDGLAGFQAKLPIVSYSELQPWIERARSGEPDVLAPGRVRHFEPTSGSGGGAKLIPYNDALLACFRSLFAIWANDLLQHLLRPRSGRVFISVSPRVSAQNRARHDADYLSGWLRLLLAPFLVTPDFRQIDTLPAGFRDELALTLIRCSDLEVISVWSPTYLLVLLAHVEARRTELAARLPRPRRRLLETNQIDWAHIWPQLQLVSCWTAAAASSPSQQLARCLPQARLQGKGLLATEAPITVPLVQATGCVPLIDEAFIELEDATGSLCLLHEARPDHDYAVIVTTPGGLTRYRLGDRVQATGRWRDTPLLDFVGRVDAVCDLVGEKLDESQVATALRTLLPTTAYALLVPEAGVTPAYYRLITDACVDNLALTLDTALCAGHRYREARALGQLASPQILMLPDARRVMHDLLIADGMAAGDIKDTALLHSLDRAARLLSEVGTYARR
jgi:hypothetical protein